MTSEEAHLSLFSVLSSNFDENEAKTIGFYILEDVFKINKIDKKILSEENIILLNEIKTRLLQNEPWQYIVGEADFYGQKFLVDKSVLIPRAETEELVYSILQIIKKEKWASPKILDIGTGLGCIPITLKLKNREAEIFGIDVSEAALEVANKNAEKLKADVTFLKSDILDWKNQDFPTFEAEKLDVIVSNPPYIPLREEYLMPQHVLKFEPHLALFVSNENELIFYTSIADFSKKYLKKGGYLFFECNEFNANDVKNHLQNADFQDVIIIKDMSNRDRMIRCNY